FEGQNSLNAADVSARYLWNAWLLRFFAASAVRFDGGPGLLGPTSCGTGVGARSAPFGTPTLRPGLPPASLSRRSDLDWSTPGSLRAATGASVFISTRVSPARRSQPSPRPATPPPIPTS